MRIEDLWDGFSGGKFFQNEFHRHADARSLRSRACASSLLTGAPRGDHDGRRHSDALTG